MNARHEVEIVESLESISAVEWDALSGNEPFCSHAFLSALENSGCVGARSGWSPCHLVIRRSGRITGAMPLYRKSHSYGEYVFDWAWAEAYRRHGLRYYPKLVSAVPFTPVTGSRLLASDAETKAALIAAALRFAAEQRMSSLHCLFPIAPEAQLMQQAGMLIRQTVQFHWRNDGYSSFDDFLGRMNHDKRKKIRQERTKLRASGIRLERLSGTEAGEAHWKFFFDCYRRTYRAHQSTPYLNLEFFLRLAHLMPQRLLLSVAVRDGRPIASSLCVRGESALYGRYWGAVEYHPGLHFECCYYQPIEHCIEQGIACFEGGAQGEHKLARGLLPIRTLSAHWLAHPRFFDAVADFLRRERRDVEQYVDELGEHSPFKTPAGARD
ncbi:MAG TPA: GNAT family N-acetyltransferase [Burkholderiales bacterium]|jgi:predicted N-acyltransferase|nr:GNAT family N-acetyltransferase [Burkholderiales bacterium]